MENKDSNEWLIVQEGYSEEKKDFYESIFSLGNGYMGVRGFTGCEKQREKYELCTYIAGIYDYFKPGITDMVNTPNFFYYDIKIGDTVLDIQEDTISEFKRSLNMKEGTLITSYIWETAAGQRLLVETCCFLSISENHTAAVRYTVTPLNFNGSFLFETGIMADVFNNPINDDQLKDEITPIQFLTLSGLNHDDNDVHSIEVKTKQSNYTITEAFTLKLKDEIGNGVEAIRRIADRDRCNIVSVELKDQIGKKIVIDKIISVYTSRDNSGQAAGNSAVADVRRTSQEGFDSLYRRNCEAWGKKWNTADIAIEGDPESQKAIRYNIFQLIQTNAESDPTVSIGARGLMHGRYKGCYFWDTEIFMLPFYIYTNPDAARNLLMYRFNTIEGAEYNAGSMNLEGARYPWMCTIDGREQCETWDTGSCEIHITADVAYAIGHYCEAAGDIGFLRDFGAEILIKTSRYWRSRFSYEAGKDRYHMLFVKGPNEYGGVTVNNTYTTLMAIHNIRLAIDAIELMKSRYPSHWTKLESALGFSESEVKDWLEITKKAVVNYDKENKLYIEDDNFFKLEPLEIGRVKTDETPLYRKLSFDRLQRYRVLKQADVILLMILLSEQFSREEKMAAWNMYEPITLHDSTLSFGTHALAAARLGLSEKAYDYFRRSVQLDLKDIMGNTGKEGIHFAAFGASWQAVVNGFGGVRLEKGVLHIDPALPPEWSRLRFRLAYRGCRIDMDITKEVLRLYLQEDSILEEIVIKYEGGDICLIKGQWCTEHYHRG